MSSTTSAFAMLLLTFLMVMIMSVRCEKDEQDLMRQKALNQILGDNSKLTNRIRNPEKNMAKRALSNDHLNVVMRLTNKVMNSLSPDQMNSLFNLALNTNGEMSPEAAKSLLNTATTVLDSLSDDDIKSVLDLAMTMMGDMAGDNDNVGPILGVVKSMLGQTSGGQIKSFLKMALTMLSGSSNGKNPLMDMASMFLGGGPSQKGGLSGLATDMWKGKSSGASQSHTSSFLGRPSGRKQNPMTGLANLLHGGSASHHQKNSIMGHVDDLMAHHELAAEGFQEQHSAQNFAQTPTLPDVQGPEEPSRTRRGQLLSKTKRH